MGGEILQTFAHVVEVARVACNSYSGHYGPYPPSEFFNCDVRFGGYIFHSWNIHVP